MSRGSRDGRGRDGQGDEPGEARVPRVHERPHRSPLPPSSGVSVSGEWGESWSFRFSTADAALAGTVELVRFPGSRMAWYTAVVMGEHRSLVAVVDRAVPFRSSPLEVRTEGLWADHLLEEPHEHWTVGLEAFAVGLDDPFRLLGDARGDVVPLGLDLEWEADGGLRGPATLGDDHGSYGLGCRVTGDVLIGAESVVVDGFGWRDHEWGHFDHGSVRSPRLRVVADDERWWFLDLAEVPARVDRDDDGLVRSVGLVHGGQEVEVVPVAVAPVPLVEGMWSSEMLVRCRLADGGLGVGWLDERLGPGGPR